MNTPLNLMAQTQLPLPGGIDWSRYAMGPAQQFFGNLTPPSAPPVDTVRTATDTATTQIRNPGSAGDQSGENRGSAPGGSVTSPFAPGSYQSGTLAGLFGTAIPMPGAGTLAGAAGTAYDVSRVNSDLNSIGLKGDLGLAQALLGNASFGLLGETPQSYFDLMTAGVPFGTLQQIAGVPVTAPVARAAAPTVQSSGSASQDFFGALSDLNNVGRLGDVLNELDAQRDTGGGGHDTPGGYGGNADSSPDPNGGHAWRYGGPVGARTAPANTKPVQGTVHTGEWVHPPESRNAYGDKVMRAIQQREIPPQKLRALV